MSDGEMSFVERMVRVSNVAWGQKPEGGYWVTWDQDDQPQEAEFDTSLGASAFAQYLDTTGEVPSRGDVMRTHRALRELERDMVKLEEEQKRETPQERRIRERAIKQLEHAVKDVRVRSHRRFWPR